MTSAGHPMRLALEQAQLAFSLGEVPVGAVLLDSVTNDVVAAAHNRSEAEGNALLHAEMNALHEGFRILGDKRLNRCDLYVTLEPCPMCAQAISVARIRRLYFGAFDPKGGGVTHGARVFDAGSCFHTPEIYGGVLEDECSELLKQFFKNRR